MAKLVQEPDARTSHYRMLSQAAETLAPPFTWTEQSQGRQNSALLMTINGPLMTPKEVGAGAQLKRAPRNASDAMKYSCCYCSFFYHCIGRENEIFALFSVPSKVKQVHCLATRYQGNRHEVELDRNRETRARHPSAVERESASHSRLARESLLCLRASSTLN